MSEFPPSQVGSPKRSSIDLRDRPTVVGMYRAASVQDEPSDGEADFSNGESLVTSGEMKSGMANKQSR